MVRPCPYPVMGTPPSWQHSSRIREVKVPALPIFLSGLGLPGRNRRRSRHWIKKLPTISVRLCLYRVMVTLSSWGRFSMTLKIHMLVLHIFLPDRGPSGHNKQRSRRMIKNPVTISVTLCLYRMMETPPL